MVLNKTDCAQLCGTNVRTSSCKGNTIKFERLIVGPIVMCDECGRMSNQSFFYLTVTVNGKIVICYQAIFFCDQAEVEGVLQFSICYVAGEV